MAKAAKNSGAPDLKAVEKIIKASAPGNEALKRFSDLFFSRAEANEFEGYTDETLAALVLSAWQFISTRKPGSHKIKVENPKSIVSSDGDVTIVEILNDDMPFLVDSIMGEIQERGHTVRLVTHPVYSIKRDGKNIDLKGVLERRKDEDRDRESYIQIHLAQIEDAQDREGLKEALSSVLETVRRVVEDWRPMLDRLDRAIAAYTAAPPPVHVSVLTESVQFLKWLLEDNFTFLGMRAFAFVGGEQRGQLEPVKESGLGILRDPSVYVLRRGNELTHMTPEVRQFFLSPEPLIVTKANVRSVVHRRVHMDYIGVKIFSETGEITGELRIVGLFTSTAYTRTTKRIPFLRQKAESVIERSGYPPNSHSGKALANVIETFPRDELFQIDVDTLYETAISIQALELRPRTRVFPRADKFDRFVSILVYVPRDRFSTSVRMRIGDHLAEVYKGRISAFYLFFPEGPLVRIHFIIGRYEGETPVIARDQLEAEVSALVRTWEDDLAAILREREPASGKASRYASAFSGAYQEARTPEQAVADIEILETLSEDAPVAIRFSHDEDDRPGRARVAIYHLSGAISLTRRVPVLENLGFAVIDERSYRIAREDDKTSNALHDMVLELQEGDGFNLEECAQRLEECFLAVWRGDAGDDHYNRLVLHAGLGWREVAALRAYGSYLRQIGAPFGQAYLSDTLKHHLGVTRSLMELFRLRFDPDNGKTKDQIAKGQKKILGEIDEALEQIPSLDEDRIIRHFLNLIVTTNRTNFYQRTAEGAPPPAIAYKLDSANVEGSPSPRPFAEIFVFSPRVEGIHLRGGRIARGGLRWSDRAQDFRTEVLGLAKAQQVKNVVIVPTGSKGGFVPKFLPQDGTREQVMEEGIAAYKLFISTLLSVTDNLTGSKVSPPERVVRHDDDDPYLVVAADKGTATFSDFANEISLDHRFWLGDAFASGGSAGYDHKKMGITARGGWEAVKRHFREMDWDIQTTPFRAIGVGDMSGDVFGNGMLLSKQTLLLAAFDHRDIFIDPDPDPAKTWKERKRMFGLARSSWQDYDRKTISKGGGIFSRSLKSIELTDEIRALLDLDAKTVTPNELMRAILRCNADLLWFGGIGTYVAANHETPEQIGDRANDAIRVKARELNVSVIGEGANLGITQDGRIEFAKSGGRINTDAIDNSAGVNSSDLEVNIKIALGSARASGKLSLEERNEFLASMTEEVAEKCLRNNYLQTLAISLGQKNGVADLGFQARLMRALERSGLLDREIENLPDDTALEERRMAGDGLTRPELAVLLAYAKIDLYNELVASKVPDDPFFATELFRYFPQTLQDNYPQEIESHRLRREIIATRLSNALINRGGSTMFIRLKEETGHPAEDITLAFTAVLTVFDLQVMFDAIDGLDNKVAGWFQLELYQRLQTLIRQQTAWFLRHGDFSKGLSTLTERYTQGVASIRKARDKVLTDEQNDRFEQDRASLEKSSVPKELADSIAFLGVAADTPEMVYVSEQTKSDIVAVGIAFGEMSRYFRIDELKSLAEKLLVTDYFDRLAINSTIGALSAAQRGIIQQAVGGSGKKGFDVWLDANRDRADRTRRALDEILDGGDFSLSKLMVAVGHLGDLGSG